MTEGNWQAVLYLDHRADRGQQQALEDIFCGREGGHPALLMGFVSRVLAMNGIRVILGRVVWVCALAFIASVAAGS